MNGRRCSLPDTPLGFVLPGYEQFKKFFENRRNRGRLRIGGTGIRLGQFKGTFKGLFVL